MMKRLRWVLAVIAVLGLVALVAGYGLMRGWHIERVTASELSAKLRPHDTILRPEGDGPFPAVVLMHGCSGVHENNHSWAEFFRDQGYVAVIVDSLNPRGLRNELDNGVCDGSVLWGRERAGDLLVTLADVRALPFVDTSKIALAGWSHGGWTIMEALALEGADELPPGLSDDPGGLEGVVGSALIYPYCGALSLSYWGKPWAGSVPSLMLLAGKDQMISTPECLETAQRLEADGQPMSVHVYPDADHAFDYTDLEPDSAFSYDPEVTADARARVSRFLQSVFGSGSPTAGE